MGDVIGTLLDLEKGEIMFWRNKKYLGVAFSKVPKGQNIVYFPAISLQRRERAIFNFGLRPFSSKIPSVCAINEPNALIHNYAVFAELICKNLKQLVTRFHDPKHNQVTDDEKYLVGITMLEYLTPLLSDPFILEGSFLELLL